MKLCEQIHHYAQAHGGGKMAFTCPETGAHITGYVGPGGTFAPTSVILVVAGKTPRLVVEKGTPPFAAAKCR